MSEPIHITPENDTREHVSDGQPCPCLARERAQPGVIVHNSYDGRECGEVFRAALDSLGIALASHDHEWTDLQRGWFEHAQDLIDMHWPAGAHADGGGEAGRAPGEE